MVNIITRTIRHLQRNHTRRPSPLRWTRLFGQFGGEVKLIPGFYHAASRSVSVAGACPGNGRFSFAR
jgi:hypothetical protein